jgi:hypothetical protein
MAALSTNDDPLKSASRKTLMQFADGHPALTHLIESGFEWPNITWRPLQAMAEFETGEFAEQSPINKLGYVVGKIRGLADQTRRDLLDAGTDSRLALGVVCTGRTSAAWRWCATRPLRFSNEFLV